MTPENLHPLVEQDLLRLFFQRHAKPLIKEALKEFLAENDIAFVKTKDLSAQLLTSREVAKMLVTTRHRVSTMIEQGLPCVYTGAARRTRRFRLEDVNAFLEKLKDR